MSAFVHRVEMSMDFAMYTRYKYIFFLFTLRGWGGFLCKGHIPCAIFPYRLFVFYSILSFTTVLLFKNVSEGHLNITSYRSYFDFYVPQ